MPKDKEAKDANRDPISGASGRPPGRDGNRSSSRGAWRPVPRRDLLRARSAP